MFPRRDEARRPARTGTLRQAPVAGRRRQTYAGAYTSPLEGAPVRQYEGLLSAGASAVVIPLVIALVCRPLEESAAAFSCPLVVLASLVLPAAEARIRPLGLGHGV